MGRWLRRGRLAGAAALAAAAALPVAVLAVVVRSEASGVHRADVAVVRAATRLTGADPELHRGLLLWQDAFQARWVNLAAAALCVWVWTRRGLRGRVLWALATVLLTWGLGNALKVLVARSRPALEDALTRAPGYSFPSGHAMNTAATGVVVVLLLWPLLGRRGRAAAVGLATVAVVATAADRVLLGAHYPSDVVAGIALGGAMAGASYLGYRGWGDRALPREVPADPATGAEATTAPRAPG
ncbi:phosphatase PAP2 family protein [Actinotalea sp. Marseille-Q4924]|uniref:phosphatase PAP2 family protein n=1 Tax=Actinotalea sp. Marseille-Q4924 TaxID=2866571 RepID=UPI001CE4B324|nr:phosphatase PAP2 family protein [Actinotalea sp. Marseille-Q4924]